MDSIEYRFEFEEICKQAVLGELLSPPKSICGGLLHQMYAIETTKGKYAIKLLNPQIMIRTTAMQNYIHSEKVATLISKKVPALPAKKINGDSVLKINNQFYLVFDWVEGKRLEDDEINNTQCEKIGEILAEIHKTDFTKLDITNDAFENDQLIDWNYYLVRGNKEHLEWYKLFSKNYENLKKWNAVANEASKMLSATTVISHRDLDPKNVMWNRNKPLVIDWESAGYINPMQDLIETAIYWSKNEQGKLNKQRFASFISGYKKNFGALHANWETVLATGFLGKLGWLEYNLKRSLRIECTDEEEQKLGTAQVTTTLNEIHLYAVTIPKLLNWLNNE
ncbi:membrane protein [Bacillus mycoides]|uniref:phosphotransferase n=1 Tax=Bacillus sp. NH11B TaxID=1866314 RepID=UPI0008FEA79C|nr:phosphotransferase [Bacillus sp. NH11B]OJD58263.1 aminoglycoside phosphotransferase [Bacillus sp. NH11B]GLV64463.1 membrane protein [Bacillus mycoides]